MADRSWPDDWNERMAGRGCPLCAAVGQAAALRVLLAS
jgi:hypothetical protein